MASKWRGKDKLSIKNIHFERIYLNYYSAVEWSLEACRMDILPCINEYHIPTWRERGYVNYTLGEYGLKTACKSRILDHWNCYSLVTSV